MIKRYVLRLSLAGLLLASGRGKALAESGLPAGALDPTFGDGGKVVTDLGGLEFLQAIAIQHDGRIVVGGGSDIAGAPDFALARYRRNGALDSRFGVGGTFLLDFGAVDFLNALALQRDGKIVAVGASNRPTGGDFALARLHSDGTLDSRFGNGGLVLTDFGQHESATAVAIQSDGKILVGGGAILPGATTRFAVARYDRDGQLDPTFGVDGVVLTDLGVAGGRLASLVQKNGRIVAVGFASGAGGADFVLVRYTRRGELDPTFGTGGWVVTDLGGVDWALAAVLQDDGKIVAAGRGGTPSQFALARYDRDGVLDPSFGAGGKVLTDFGALSFAEAMAVQKDGKIVTGGLSFAGGVPGPFGIPGNFALARYGRDGSLDSSFGTDGKVLTDLGGDDDVSALALQCNGKIVVAGFSDAGGTFDFALARYLK